MKGQGAAGKGHNLGSATKHGTPIERTGDWKAWKTILKQAGVRDVRVHDARHTAATLLIEQGVIIRAVATTTPAKIERPFPRARGEDLSPA
ncbi:tyrosine-type recombinase/integrase [Nonomuraea jabiensis]|uniref:tyrosine-type recombinase/integrase n=1 Tax=Nonomuraea jabiensis TaxID=882448 RepID=UPI003427D0CD